MSRTPDHSFHVEVHRAFAPLESEWRALEAQGRATAFQRFDFVAPLYAAMTEYQRAEPLVVLVRKDRTAPVSMIMPLCRYRDSGVTIIGCADLRVADYCAPVLAAGFDPDRATFARLWKAIERTLPKSDLVRLSKLPERLGNGSNPLTGLAPCKAYHIAAHGIAIAHPWSEHCVGKIPDKQRSMLRRNGAALERLGTVTFAFADGGSDAEAIFETLYAMRTKRFASLGRNDVMADPMWAGFYNDLIQGRTAQPFARLCILRSGEAPVACGLGLVHDGAFLLLIPSFDMERFGKFGPGRLLVYRAMEAFAASGLTYFDLTIGDEPYKRTLGADDRVLFEVVRARSLRGALAAAVWQAKMRLRKHPVLQAHMKRLLRRGG